MLISYKWLQEHFEDNLPEPQKIADALTMHSNEIESIETKGDDFIIDVKILPNRAHDCLSHEGIAREVSVLLGLSLKKKNIEVVQRGDTIHSLALDIQDKKLCPRYQGSIIEGVKVGPSPDWLKEKLHAIGQRSINNIVDITNFIMFETGQPMHAFDADKLTKDNAGNISIIIRKAKEGEKIVTLDGKEVLLNENILIISDSTDTLAIAGIKGGNKAEVDTNTVNIILESANFQAENVRRTAQSIGIKTDSSKRFENEITPEFAEKGMSLAVSLVKNIAGDGLTKFGETVDIYPYKRKPYVSGVSVGEVNKVLGTELSEAKVAEILNKLKFYFEIVRPIDVVSELSQKFLGAPYKYGASISYDAPDYFDCSSLVSYIYSRAGISIPRMTIDQYFFGREINRDELELGDVIFASNNGNGPSTPTHKKSKEFLPGSSVDESIDHNGIYLGDGKVLHASGLWHKGSVVIENLDDTPAFKNLRGFRRILENNENRFVVTVPTERLDLVAKRSFLVSGNKEDLIEEIGRVYGYENVVARMPEVSGEKPKTNKSVYYINLVRSILVDAGFSEVYNYAFVNKGKVEAANPIAEDKKFLRDNLTDGIKNSLDFNVRNAPLLGLEEVKIFEVGKVFESLENEYYSFAIGISVAKNMKKKDVREKELIDETIGILSEKLGLGLSSQEGSSDHRKAGLGQEISGKMDGGVIEFNLSEAINILPDTDTYGDVIASHCDSHKEMVYRKISQYPFMLRDVALFVSGDISADDIEEVIVRESGDLLVNVKLFDIFKKTLEDGTEKISYAFRLVFQSQEKTLSDDEVNLIMDKVYGELKNRGWEIR